MQSPSKREIYQEGNYFFPLDDVVDTAVERIRQAYTFSLQLGLGRLYVCFSGGKDSVAVLGLCKRAFGDDLLSCCEFHYNVTGIDHPKLFYFIRENFPYAVYDYPKTNIWKLILKNKTPPTRLMRYCCAELKERGGVGRFCLTGVRWAESIRRKNNRGVLERDGVILNADNDEDRKQIEHCIPKQKYICNPIVDWSEEEVWRFIVRDNLPYCSLYDEGFDRLGCIGCPMDTDRAKVLEAYPKFKRQYIRTFDKLVELRKEKGLSCTWQNGEEVYNWWIEV